MARLSEDSTPPSAGSSVAFTDRGAWATTTAYVVGDVVTQGGSRYLVTTAHTSGTFATDLAAAKLLSLDGGVAGAEDVTTVASSGASQTLTLPTGGIGTFDVTLTAATVALTFAGATAGKADSLTVIARQDATGGRLVTWPASVVWIGGLAPTLSTAANATDIISFVTVNGGTTWYGFAGTATLSTATARSGAYFTTSGSVGTSAVARNSLYAMPLDLGSCTLVRIGAEVTTLQASTTVRLGLYRDSAGQPGTLLLDAGTIDCSTTGAKEITISQVVTGKFWAVAVAQGAADPGLRIINTVGGLPPIVGYSTLGTATANTGVSYLASGSVSGALPGTFTMGDANTVGIRVAVKVG